MCASPPAGDGEKLDMLINMLSNMSEKIEKLDERVKDVEMDNENENSTVAIKSECSDKEKHEVNLTSLGLLIPEEAGKYRRSINYQDDETHGEGVINKLPRR